MPSQLAYHFWPSASYVYGLRIDYLSPTLYLTDVIFFALVIIRFIENQGKQRKKTLSKKMVVLTGLFIFLNIMASQRWGITLLKWIKLIELGAVSYYFYSEKIISSKMLVTPLVLSTFYVTVIALIQFITSRTTGVFYFLGERSFDSLTPGISLVNIGGDILLRPYSTFSHPNSMGGFMITSFLTILAIRNKKSLMAKIGLLAAAILITLSFSLNSYLTIALILLTLFLSKVKFESLARTLPIILTTVSVGLMFVGIPKGVPVEISNRLYLVQAAKEVIGESILFGRGIGSFVVELSSTSIAPDISWLLQPVHNIYLLLLSEGGLIILLSFYFLYRKLIERVLFSWKRPGKKRESVKFLLLALLSVLILGTSDHFVITLQQNALQLAMIVGLLLKTSTRKKSSFFLN